MAWALSQVKNNGMSVEKVAELVGCSHVALTLWKTGKTPLENAQIGLVERFCEVTGVSMHWLLHGGPTRVDIYSMSDEVAALAQKLKVMEERNHDAFSMVSRIIDVAAPTDRDAKPPLAN